MTLITQLTRSLRDVFAPIDERAVWQWAEDEIVLTRRQTETPGPYSTLLTPYVREPLQCFADASVTDVAHCWGTQTSKTTMIMIGAAWRLVNNPFPTVWVMPTESLVRSFSEARWQPMVDDCKPLAALKPHSPNRYKTLEQHFRDATLTFVGSNSPANLASRPAGLLLMDETDKFSEATTKESSAVALAENRTKSYTNALRVKTSTPTTPEGEIWTAFLAGDQRYYFVPCPHGGDSAAHSHGRELYGGRRRAGISTKEAGMSSGRKARAARRRKAEAAQLVPVQESHPMDSRALARILRPQAAYRWILPQLSAITPQYVEAVLRGALAGNHVQQWELFDLMLDTWPELAACGAELRDGVLGRNMVFDPYVEDGEAASDEAVERSGLVSAALRRMRPDVCSDENDLDGTLRDILDGWFRGVTCLEVDWQATQSARYGRMIAPRAMWWVHPVCFGWDAQTGRLGLRAAHDGQNAGPVVPLPTHKFLVGIHKAKSGSTLGGALLRPLAWWWCAANFSADWLLNLAQVFGLPFRWANYDAHAPQATVDAICNMLQNMGSAGWAAFPTGTTLELKEATKEGGDHSPQGELLDRADRYARLLILGQTMSGSQDASKGGGKAFGAVETGVKEQRMDAAAKYVCAVLNGQLIPSILTLNYGDTEEAPTVRLLNDEDMGLTEAQRDRTLIEAGLTVSAAFLRKKYGLPEPTGEEDVVGAAPMDEVSRGG